MLRRVSFLLTVSAVSVCALLHSPPKRMRYLSQCDGKGICMTAMETSRFLDFKTAQKITNSHQTPLYVYSEKELRSQAEKAINFPNPFGLTVRFAMKACPNAAVLQLFHSMGINFDASSGYEVERAVRAGISPSKMSLSSQELPHNFDEIIRMGTEFNACSLHQLETFGRLFPGKSCGVRFNPGKGSGGTGKTVGFGNLGFGPLNISTSVLFRMWEDHHHHLGFGMSKKIW